MAHQDEKTGHSAPAYSTDPVRTRLAHTYLRGEGVEFGALHAGLAMPPGVRVRYADVTDGAELHAFFPDQKGIRAPDIVTSLESMDAIAPDSLDFIVANHVLEHTENPLRALKAIASRLKPDGIAYLALPDKRYTFDEPREITPLAHIVRDEQEGPEWSIRGHYTEWVTLVDKITGAHRDAIIHEMLRMRSNIHFHVWDLSAMQEMFDYVDRREDIELRTVENVVNGIEVIWLLQRRKTPIIRPRTLLHPGVCLVCTHDTFDEFAPGSLTHYPVYSCRQCGFVFSWPRVPEDFADHPEEIYFHDSSLETAPSNAALARELDRTARAWLAKDGGEPDAVLAAARLLEVGCAGGVLLPYFRALDWQIEGVDPWRAAAQAGRKYLGVPITIAKLEDANLAKETYDFVLINDTLQFVVDPKALLGLCRDLLREGGVMMIEVPNFHSQEFRQHGARAPMFLPAHYISYFCAETLTAMLAALGCELLDTLIYGGESQDSRLRVWARLPHR